MPQGSFQKSGRMVCKPLCNPERSEKRKRAGIRRWLPVRWNLCFVPLRLCLFSGCGCLASAYLSYLMIFRNFSMSFLII